MAKIKKFDMEDRKMKDFSTIPNGTVVIAKITGETDKKNSTGTGRYLNFEFEVCKGEYKGRKFWTLLNYEHENDKCVEIAMDELADITRACNFNSIQKDTEALHGIPMQCTLRVEKGNDGNKDKNRVTKYESVSGGKENKPDFGDDKKSGKKKDKKKNKKNKNDDVPF